MVKFKTGFILLIVVGLLGILAFISVHFITVTTSHSQLTTNRLFKVRSQLIARSGFDFALEKFQQDITFFDQGEFKATIGKGTLIRGGDQFIATAHDNNARINVNDGVDAGLFNLGTPGIDIFSYEAYAIDPFHNNNHTNPWGTSGEGRSVFFNLRLRRILNAYGDVHRFVDFVCHGDYHNLKDFYQSPLPNPPFSIDASNSSDGRRGKNMAYPANDIENMGLGDQIIMDRPPLGYESFNIIKNIIDRWALHERINLSKEYLEKTNQSFYELIKDDLTLNCFLDDQFYDFVMESRVGKFQADEEINDPQKGNFFAFDLYNSPPFLTSSTLPNSAMWRQHHVPLINLNHASFFVRSAVFYAPVNVSYSCESTTTIPPYHIADPDISTEYLTQNTAIEAMLPSPSIGVTQATFADNLEILENGIANIGRSSHLMSLRDAMTVALAYEKYIDRNKNPTTPIHNFDDFRDFLIYHEQTVTSKNGTLPYERAWPLGDSAGQPTHRIDDPNHDFNANGLFHVSSFDAQGIFLQDYVSKTLPHIFSCIRRIPSYYCAPAALQSPYLIRKPDYNNEDYKAGYPCEQGFVKVEDFLWRAPYPKVCFLSCGSASISSTGMIRDQQNIALSTSHMSADVELFTTQYYRSQVDFKDMTDPQTHESILFGPETNTDSPFLGVVGLKDYDQDVNDSFDTFISQGSDLKGYHPQIVMNFAYNLGHDPPLFGFENTSDVSDLFPASHSFSADQWAGALDILDYPSYSQPHMEGGDKALFGSFVVPFLNSNLSPFNGFFLRNIGNGLFDKPSLSSPFDNALYWRMDPWLLPNDNPIGEDVSRGIMTFWFRTPSDYDYPTMVRIPETGVEIASESFSRVFVHLNFWEKYQFLEFPPTATIPRAVSITVGIKKTRRRGLNIFARYDSGGEPHDGISYYPYQGATPFDNQSSLVISEYLGSYTHQYDFLGMWAHSSTIEYEEGFLTYQNYRRIAHRSVEVSAQLKNQKECGPGSWHRASVFWNFMWDGGSDMDSSQQLGIDLHDHSNKKGINEFRHGVASPVGVYEEGDPFHYPQDHNPLSEGANTGFMFPFDSSMILSIGESHTRRLGNYSLFYRNYNNDQSFFTTSNTEGKYYPYWRLNSVIDNLRIYIGPSDPALDTTTPIDYFKQDFVSSTWLSNPYGAMRYQVINENHPSGDFEQTIEPDWIIQPLIPVESKVHSIGTRVYYPPDSDRNTSYVYFSASNDDDLNAVTPTLVSQNEQNLFYDRLPVTDKFRLRLQYTAYKPSLDGDQTNRKGEPLIYYGADNFTQIPWIKEISLRYALPGNIKISNWSYD